MRGKRVINKSRKEDERSDACSLQTAGEKEQGKTGRKGALVRESTEREENRGEGEDMHECNHCRSGRLGWGQVGPKE